eukprot:CAMPEP_0113598238 /NCGR_PEP_ID=MMETSP0015_2-20120614/41464_1 /TAXON_ID=2838 /ORGANISM="Odontella" /LENGTH=68 /DNA_ID=CAMNT_0000506209 /DNA_START=56 /DNA_END=258 /DNA_ORIENTATION=- /assembly_acc=CAM_ASM_000160
MATALWSMFHLHALCAPKTQIVMMEMPAMGLRHVISLQVSAFAAPEHPWNARAMALHATAWRHVTLTL